MRKIIAIILALAALLSLTACAPSETVTPPFFMVHDDTTGGTVYMLGTMHVGRSNTEYPQYILEQIENCSFAAAEFDTQDFSGSRAEIKRCANLIACEGNLLAEDYFGEENYTLVRDTFNKKGIYNSQLDLFQPYYWASALSTGIAAECGLSTSSGSENIILTKVKQADKKLVEIESAYEQYETMAKIPMPIQIYAVTSGVGENYDKELENMNRLYAAWSSGDHETLREMSVEEVPEELAEDYAEFERLMYNDRQTHMADMVKEWLAQGETVFMFVGAMHFYKGVTIIDHLNEAGYTVYEIRGTAEVEPIDSVIQTEYTAA